jgi:hypothetical protein
MVAPGERWAQHVAELDARGFTVARGVVGEAACAAARAMMDAHLGPAGGAAPMADPSGRPYQPRPWPLLSAREGGGPVVNYVSQLRAGRAPGFVRQVEHPIRAAAAAAVVAPMVPLVAAGLRCKDPARELCLIHQNFRRTDPSPPPHPAPHFHMDSGFLPAHYAAWPRQHYFLTVLALSPMVRGGAAFCVAPGSFEAARRAGEALPSSEAAAVDAAAARIALPALLGQGVPGSAVTLAREAASAQQQGVQGAQLLVEGVEQEMAVGDLLVFDPMLSHAGSAFREGVRHAAGAGRHALFSVFAGRAALGTSLAGLPSRAYAAPASKFPSEFRRGLPAALRGMLDWTLPTEGAAAAAAADGRPTKVASGRMGRGGAVAKL